MIRIYDEFKAEIETVQQHMDEAKLNGQTN